MRHPQQSLPALAILFILCCHASCAVAQNDTSTNSTSSNSTSMVPVVYDTTMNVPVGFLGSLALIAGLYLLGFGYRYYRLTTFLSGTCILGVSAYVALTNYESLSSPYPMGALLGVSFAVGILGGGLACWLWRVGLYGVPLMGGFFVGAWILGWGDGTLVQDLSAQIVILVSPMVILLILLFFFESAIILIGTSFTGAYIIIWGLDRLFLDTDFSLCVQVLLDRNHRQPWYTVDWKIYTLLGAVMLGAILGTLVQWGVWMASKRRLMFRDLLGETEAAFKKETRGDDEGEEEEEEEEIEEGEEEEMRTQPRAVELLDMLAYRRSEIRS